MKKIVATFICLAMVMMVLPIVALANPEQEIVVAEG